MNETVRNRGDDSGGERERRGKGRRERGERLIERERGE